MVTEYRADSASVQLEVLIFDPIYSAQEVLKMSRMKEKQCQNLIVSGVYTAIFIAVVLI